MRRAVAQAPEPVATASCRPCLPPTRAIVTCGLHLGRHNARNSRARVAINVGINPPLEISTGKQALPSIAHIDPLHQAWQFSLVSDRLY